MGGDRHQEDRVGKEFFPALERLLANGDFRENAKHLAMKYAGYDRDRVAERIANTIERLPHKVNKLQICPERTLSAVQDI